MAYRDQYSRYWFDILVLSGIRLPVYSIAKIINNSSPQIWSKVCQLHFQNKQSLEDTILAVCQQEDTNYDEEVSVAFLQLSLTHYKAHFIQKIAREFHYLLGGLYQKVIP